MSTVLVTTISIANIRTTTARVVIARASQIAVTRVVVSTRAILIGIVDSVTRRITTAWGIVCSPTVPIIGVQRVAKGLPIELRGLSEVAITLVKVVSITLVKVGVETLVEVRT